MTTNRLSKSEGKFSLKGMTDKEKLEWANANGPEANAERAKLGLPPIHWIMRDGHLMIEYLHPAARSV